MARVHNMDTFKTLVLDNNMEGITWELGNSEKYIKTLFYNGQPIVNNCQQYNMSGRNHELFEILQANMDMACDTSASESKQLQRANERGSRVVQVRTYAKTEINKQDNDTQQLVKEKDLIKILEHYDYDTDLIRGLYIDKYSDDIDFLNKTYSTFDFDFAFKNGGVVKVDASHLITKTTLEKINSLVDRMIELKKEIKGV